jgi:hypothetical protein
VHEDAQVARRFALLRVGCGQLIYHKDGETDSIEGDPESPISQGNLARKAALSPLTHNRRETKMKSRAARERMD